MTQSQILKLSLELRLKGVFFNFILLDYLINLLGGSCLAVWVKKKVLEIY